MVPEPVGAALRLLARQEPATPVCAYVYDTAVLRARVAEVKAALPSSATLLYAVKANGHPDVVQTLADAADGLEVASGGELALAVAAGARRIAFGGPAKTPAELSAAVAAGATVNAESVLELRRLARAAAGRPVRVALRVNRPGATLSGSHQMTGTPTPFGLDPDQIDDAVAVARAAPGIDLVGFHLHAVSNSLDAPGYAGFVRDAVAWSLDAAGRYGIELREVNVGGGFGIDYTGDALFDLAALSVLDGGPAPLVFELGRYLAADAGWYAAEVLDLKRTHGRWFAVLRGGTHHFRLPAAWGYSHPFDVLPMPWTEPFDRPAVRDVAVDAVGELCTTKDVLARGQPVAELRVGDLLVFARTGAYGWDISHHEFLRHPYPRVLVM